MKIAVYAIALNEEKFVQRWYESAKDADYILIADTGSTDNTIGIAESLGINVVKIEVKPWRFDNARNASLKAIPEDIDICIALDMDEVLVEGWREQLELINPNTTRPRYKYIWNWKKDGTPGLIYGGDKIHSRKDYYWKHPVHEVLQSSSNEVQEWIGLEIHHHADDSKSRSQYFDLLELAVAEDPEDDRNSYYLAREYYFHNKVDKAITEFKRHLSLPRAVWRPERSSSMRYLAKLEPYERESWLLRAAAEAPDRREPWVELASLYYENKQWEQCYAASKKAISIKEKPLEYLCEDFAWGIAPYDYAAISAYYIGLYHAALKYGSIAQEIEPENTRLSDNMVFYKAAAIGKLNG